MKNQTPSYQRHRFTSTFISHAVWLYHRFCLSFHEVEELLAERGITVTYETVRQLWSAKIMQLWFLAHIRDVIHPEQDDSKP